MSPPEVSRPERALLTKQAHVALDTVCWPGDLDIAPETLIDKPKPVEFNPG